MAEDNILKDTIDVTPNTITYTFGVPSLSDEIKLGIIERNIRRDLDPTTGGDPSGLDGTTYTLVQTAAVFQYLLRGCTDKWPYSTDANGKPTVDYTKWDKQRIGEAIQAYIAYRDAVNRFRETGVLNGNGKSEVPVEGEPGT